MLDPSTLLDRPPKVPIPTAIYRPLPHTRSALSWPTIDAGAAAGPLVEKFTRALVSGDADSLAECLLPDDGDDDESMHGPARWRDSLALTAHLRTFSGRRRIVPALVELCAKRSVRDVVVSQKGVVREAGEAVWIESLFTFRTEAPAPAECGSKLMILPDTSASPTGWKIWCLATWLVAWESHREDEGLLRIPSVPIGSESELSTDVVIVGGGNAGIIQAARLKALGVEFIVIERNANVGDNWAKRYDYLKFHTGKGWGETPYLQYPKNVGNPSLTRDDLATHLSRYSKEFDLDSRVLTRSHVTATSRDKKVGRWKLSVSTDGVEGERHISCRCMVLATASGFSGRYVPEIPGLNEYKGLSIHSNEFKNGKETLATKGVKSVIIVGSANTAFDVLEDCHAAGLRATMIQRSPTYVIPMGHLLHPHGLGMYDVSPDADACDVGIFVTPLHVGGPMLARVHRDLDSQEPYDAVKKAGYLALDSAQADLLDWLFNRQGGHLVDMSTGGISLIASGTVPIHSSVSPASFTPSGLLLSNGVSVAADAVVWCTGFGVHDGRRMLDAVLGAGAEAIAPRMEPTWGVDAEGEVRGLWKRTKGVDGVWVHAGGGADHRWHSKVITLQIKGYLEGILPEPYRGMAA